MKELKDIQSLSLCMNITQRYPLFGFSFYCSLDFIVYFKDNFVAGMIKCQFDIFFR